jgi:hypothetical protein
MRMRPASLAGFVLFALSVAGCQAAVGTGGFVSVPPDGAAQCTAHCQTMGLDLSAVVVMANNVGCVCSPAPTHTGAPPRSAAAASGGMAAMEMAQEERDRQSRTQSSRH